MANFRTTKYTIIPSKGNKNEPPAYSKSANSRGCGCNGPKPQRPHPNNDDCYNEKPAYSSRPCCAPPCEPCSVQVVQSCPPQACALPPPRIQCRYIIDDNSKSCTVGRRKYNDDCHEKHEECCDDGKHWLCDADSLVCCVLLVTIILTVAALIADGTFNIDVGFTIGKIKSSLGWIVGGLFD